MATKTVPGQRMFASRHNMPVVELAGKLEGISSAMAKFAKATERAGYELSGQARLVFSCDGNCSKEYTVVELQLGIE